MLHGQILSLGAAGGAMVSLATLYQHIQTRSQWPWAVKSGPTKPMYFTSEVIRVLLGAGVAWGLAATDQLGLFGAIVVGAGAPAILDKWQRAAPGLAMPEHATAGASHTPHDADPA